VGSVRADNLRQAENFPKEQSKDSMNGEATSKCSPRQITGIWIGLQIAIFLSALDQTILNIVIPKIATVLNALDKSAWIITAYLLFSTIATPISGKLADIYGVKKVLTLATLLFAAASALCGTAGLVPQICGLDAIDQLILARALQGTAGGAMLGLCFVSIGEIFPVGSRGKYQGFLAAAFIVAALIGPTLGGYIADASTWRLVFYLNIPLALVAALFFAGSFPLSSRARAQTIIDFGGIALFIGAIVPVILGASELGRLGQISIFSALAFAIAAVCFIAFLWREQKAREPLIPLSLFADKLIAISLTTVFITGIGLFGSMLLLAFILQQIMGMSATTAGVTLTPLMIVVAGSSIAGGLILAKTGKYKILCLVALALLATGTFMLSQLTAASPSLVLLEGGAVGGLGMGLLLPVHTIIIQKVAAGEIMGVATAMTQFFRSMGGTIGTGLMSALLLCLMKLGSLQQAISQVLGIYAGLIVLTLVLNFFLPEVPLKKVSSDNANLQTNPNSQSNPT
jgi:EmrB/QacA subfamily drug resistance transporter